jgi:hypothetical protein
MSLNNINQLIFVMVKYSVFFEVRTECLNIIKTSFDIKGLCSCCEAKNRTVGQ